MLIRRAQLDGLFVAETREKIARLKDGAATVAQVNDLRDRLSRLQETQISAKDLAKLQRQIEALEEKHGKALAELKDDGAVKALAKRIEVIEAKPEPVEHPHENTEVLERRIADVENRKRTFRFEIERGSDDRITGVTAYEVNGGERLDSLQDEISRIENTMRTNRKAYNKAMQAEYRKLLERRESLLKH